jgi:hypothetical protein
MEVGAYQTHRVVRLGMARVHLGSHLADQSDSDMDLLGHQGHQKEDSHQAGTDRVEGSLAAVVGVAGLAARHPGEAETAVPIAHVVLAEGA